MLHSVSSRMTETSMQVNAVQSAVPTQINVHGVATLASVRTNKAMLGVYPQPPAWSLGTHQ